MATVFSDFNRPSMLALPSTEGFVEAHWKSYIRVVNECCVALASIWTEVGLGLTEVESELGSIAGRTTAVWSGAVAAAEEHKKDLVDNIRRLEIEINSWSTQLGETFEYDVNKKSIQTLKERFESINKLRDEFKNVKANRVAEFKDVLDEIDTVRAQFGQPIDKALDFDDPKCNLSKHSLELLKCDLESFHIERSRRLQTLDSLWSILKTMCTELGEDPLEMMKSVHPSLEFIDQRGIATQTARKLMENSSFNSDAWQNSQISKPLCLSQEAFAKIEDKLSWLRNERIKRESTLQSKRESLESLWEALQMPMADLERSILTRLMDGPARFHQKTLDRIQEEIDRQETAKARVLRTLVDKKLEEITRVCEAGRLERPSFVHELIDRNRNESSPTPGHFAEALGSLNRLISDTRRLVQRREEIVELIEEFENAHHEIKWLIDYEQDEDRYKGRDCNRKLKRAIKAGKLRDRFPSALEKLRSVILDWERIEHKPFVIDGVNYRLEVLDTFDMIIPSNQEVKRTPNQRSKKLSMDQTSSPGSKGSPNGKKSVSKSTSFKGRIRREKATAVLRPQTSVGMSSSREIVNERGLFSDYDIELESLQQRHSYKIGLSHSVPSPGMKSAIPISPKPSIKKQQNESKLFRTKTPSSSPHGSNKKVKEPSRELDDEITHDAYAKRKTSLPSPKLTQNPFHSCFRKSGVSNKNTSYSRRTSL
eukprot:g5945.t1